MQQPGMPQPGMQQPGMQQPGAPAGFGQPGAPQPGMPGAAPGFGAPPGGMMAPGGAPMAAGAIGPRPKRRNPWIVFLTPILCVVLGQIIGAVLAAAIDPMLALVGSLIAFVGSILGLVWLIMMLLDLKKVSQDDGFMWWLLFIPCANYYLLWLLTPQTVTKAKQMAGLQVPARHIVLYIFFPLYALAADLNDLAGP
jgi:hypothetical protein